MNAHRINNMITFAKPKRPDTPLTDDLAIQLHMALKNAVSLKIGTTTIRPMNSKINVHQAANSNSA